MRVGLPLRRLGLLLGSLPLMACVTATGGAPAVALEGHDWALVRMEGESLTLARAPSLRIDKAASQAAGFSGCNRYSGSVTLGEGVMRFGPLIGTRMACVEGMDVEQRYLKLLAQTDRYRIDGDSLVLLSGERSLLGYRAVAAK